MKKDNSAIKTKAFQDYTPEQFANCYICGWANEKGLKLKTYWKDDRSYETISLFKPLPEHTAIPGVVNGGILASIIDCHCINTAMAYGYRKEGREMNTEPSIKCMTGSMKIDYLKITPIDHTIEIRGRVKEVNGRKIIVHAEVIADGIITVRGEVVAVEIYKSPKF